MKMADGDALQIEWIKGRAETVQLEATFERQAEPKGRGTLSLIVNGKEVGPA